MAGKAIVKKFSKKNIPGFVQELLDYLEPVLSQRGVELDFTDCRFVDKELILDTRIILEGSKSLEQLQVAGNTPYSLGDILDVPRAGLVEVVGYTRHNQSKPLIVLDSAGKRLNIPVFPTYRDFKVSSFKWPRIKKVKKLNKCS